MLTHDHTLQDTKVRRCVGCIDYVYNIKMEGCGGGGGIEWSDGIQCTLIWTYSKHDPSSEHSVTLTE